jgi:polyisoprenoid-binding protein YceI
MSTQTPSRVSLPTATWSVDPAHSQVEFRVKHVGIATFKGRFAAFEGTIRTEDDSIASVEGSVDVSSVRTNDERLDGHLQSADFFDAENHPNITVKTLGPAEATDGGLRLRADLTIRGITKPVEFDLRIEGHGVDPWGNERIALAALAEIDRTDWNITWNTLLENGSQYLGERVTLALDAEAVRQAA